MCFLWQVPSEKPMWKNQVVRHVMLCGTKSNSQCYRGSWCVQGQAAYEEQQFFLDCLILNINAPWSLATLNYSSNDIGIYPRNESSATLLWESQILQACVAVQPGYNPGYLKTTSNNLHKSVFYYAQFLRWIFTRSFSAPVQTDPGAQPASYTMGTVSFPGESGRGVALTTHSHLAPRLKKE